MIARSVTYNGIMTNSTYITNKNKILLEKHLRWFPIIISFLLDIASIRKVILFSVFTLILFFKDQMNFKICCYFYDIFFIYFYDLYNTQNINHAWNLVDKYTTSNNDTRGYMSYICQTTFVFNWNETNARRKSIWNDNYIPTIVLDFISYEFI